MKEKREAKSTVSTDEGVFEIKVIVDLTPEDLVEHMTKCALGELAGSAVYKSLENNCTLNRELKQMLIIRRT